MAEGMECYCRGNLAEPSEISVLLWRTASLWEIIYSHGGLGYPRGLLPGMAAAESESLHGADRQATLGITPLSPFPALRLTRSRKRLAEPEHSSPWSRPYSPVSAERCSQFVLLVIAAVSRKAPFISLVLILEPEITIGVHRDGQIYRHSDIEDPKETGLYARNALCGVVDDEEQ